MNKKTIKDIDLKGKKVLLRCDFNVPYDEKRNITDNKRIRAALPTIKYLLEQDCKIILCSHLGKPKGVVNPEYSLDIVAEELSRLLGQEVTLAKDVVGEDAKEKAEALKNKQVMLLENVRFEKGEEINDTNLAKELASMAEVYVNDAFGAAHRAHSSNVGVAEYLPSVAGFLMEKELDYLGTALEEPQRPFVAILGGSKVSSKMGVIRSLLGKVDKLIIGGAMANTFLKAQGYEIGSSLVENDKLDLAKALMKEAEALGVELVLPVDARTGITKKVDGKKTIVDLGPRMFEFVSEENQEDNNWSVYDIGPQTEQVFKDALNGAKTVIWNGPVGMFENIAYIKGTENMAKTLAEMEDAVTIVGGGDSAAAVGNMGLADKFDHVSTGGGASLEFLEGKELPGVACLMDKDREISVEEVFAVIQQTRVSEPIDVMTGISRVGIEQDEKGVTRVDD